MVKTKLKSGNLTEEEVDLVYEWLTALPKDEKWNLETEWMTDSSIDVPFLEWAKKLMEEDYYG